MKRLRKLEGIVEELSGQIELEAVRHPGSSAASPDHLAGHDHEGIRNIGAHRMGTDAASVSGSSHGPASPAQSSGTGSGVPSGKLSSGAGHLKRTPTDVSKQFGRLVLNDKGVTRYVSSGFWSSINDELDEIRRETQEITDEDYDDSDLEASPKSAEQEKTPAPHQSFILGYRSADVDLRPLHPLPSQIPFIWQVYIENVDPVLKVVHVPTMTKTIKELRKNMDSITPSLEALMFSIYYAAIISLDEDEVRTNFGAEKSQLVQQYRFALEQALAKADFITIPDLTVAQAFLIFLVLVRRHDDTRFSWTLTGLCIRISQALGLHRDGTHFPSLTPFEIEMRRRLFYAVCVLDLRSAEDQGTDLTIMERAYDTQMPLNINDTDISPESTELPAPRDGPTDMTFSLIRYEICALSRRLHNASSAMAPICPRDADTTLEEREALLAEVHQRVESKYLNKTTADNPVYWVAATIARVIVARMTLVIYQPVLFPGQGNEDLSHEKQERLFNAAIEIFEYNHLLNTDPRCKQWRWMFQTYTQWQAVAYLLIQISHRPWGPLSERAWTALNSSYSAPTAQELEKMAVNTALWLPFKKMFLKAQRHRESEIARLRADPQAAQQLEMQQRVVVPPKNFASLPGSMKISLAHDRWRKLVNAPPLPPEFKRSTQQTAPADSARLPPASTGSAPVGGNRPQVGGNPAADRDSNNRPDFLDYLDAAMTTPTFNPQDFAPMWSDRDATGLDLANAGVFAYPGEMAGVDGLATGGPFSSSGRPGATNNPMSGYQATPTGTPQQQSRGVDATTPGIGTTGLSPQFTDDNPPPWMWPGAGLTEALRVPNLSGPGGVEDLDVNMDLDEGFDWQNWQESLGRFEANGPGASGTAWSAGI